MNACSKTHLYNTLRQSDIKRTSIPNTTGYDSLVTNFSKLKEKRFLEFLKIIKFKFNQTKLI